MKVVIAFARKLRRTKLKGRRVFSRQLSRDETRESKSNPHAIGVRSSMEKRDRDEEFNVTTRSVESADFAPAFSTAHHLPPTYAESISSQPPTDPSISVSEPSSPCALNVSDSEQKTTKTVEKFEHESLNLDSTAKSSASAAPVTLPLPDSGGRGRSIEIFYRSQLSDLARRKMMWRPSPLKVKRKMASSQSSMDDYMALKLQRQALHWWDHLALLKVLLLLGALAAYVLFLLGY